VAFHWKKERGATAHRKFTEKRKNEKERGGGSSGESTKKRGKRKGVKKKQ